MASNWIGGRLWVTWGQGITSELPMFLGSQVAAARWMQALVCVALLVCVLIIVVLPQVDLPPTTLQARSIAPVALIKVAVPAVMFAIRLQTSLPHPEYVFQEEQFHALSSRLSIMCELLC